HTRFSRDWSSDVCSSDLTHEEASVDVNDRAIGEPCVFAAEISNAAGNFDGIANTTNRNLSSVAFVNAGGGILCHGGTEYGRGPQIGRASCRERVEHSAAG